VTTPGIPSATAPTPRNVLLVEDTASLRLVYAAILRKAGFEVREAATGHDALAEIARAPCAVIVADLMLPDRDGLDLIRDLLARAPEARVVALTADGSILRAVAAMRAGASDFLVKPFDEARLVAAARNALAAGALRPEAVAPPRTGASPCATDAGVARGTGRDGTDGGESGTGGAGAPEGFGDLLGDSPAMAAVRARIARSARSMATIFITGEGGTGKEVCAREIHRLSPRAAGPFVPLDCAATPAGVFEAELFGDRRTPGAAAAADGGTLFLDGVCAVPAALQGKLLRVLQTATLPGTGGAGARRIDVRVLCASTRDPAAEMRAGRLRADLFYHLHVVPIHLPPLRERGTDIVALAEGALAKFARAEGKRFTGLSEEVRATFLRLPWPGNLRQLLNVLHNAVALHDGPLVTRDMLDEATLGLDPRPGAPPDRAAGLAGLRGRSLAEIERLVIEDAIATAGGSVARAARALGVSPSTIYRKREAWARAASGGTVR